MQPAHPKGEEIVPQTLNYVMCFSNNKPFHNNIIELQLIVGVRSFAREVQGIGPHWGAVFHGFELFMTQR